MPVTIEELKEKIARVQQQLNEVSAALDELDELAPDELAMPATENAAQNGTSSDVIAVEVGEAPQASPPAFDPRSPAEILADLGYVSGRELKPLMDKAFIEMGFDITEPAPTPREVQELMLREGVNPDDNWGSRAIIEMREE